MEFFVRSRTGMLTSQTPPPSTPPADQSRNMLKDSHHEHEKTLKSGQYIKAPGRDLYLFMQEDGNLCFYPNLQKISSSCIWSSATFNKGRGPYRLIMQDDGNLVIYDADNKATWATGTHGKGSGCHFYCQEDGNLVIYDNQKRPIWASDTRA